MGTEEGGQRTVVRTRSARRGNEACMPLAKGMTRCFKLLYGLVSVSCHQPSTISSRYPIFIVKIPICRCIAVGETSGASATE
jgi:hypothetical protein